MIYAYTSPTWQGSSGKWYFLCTHSQKLTPFLLIYLPFIF
uniref:Uncharacterized protein n=1 Tax=Anguilla anguilla TaxID=7936 RepID=A0A0E9RMQ7_ANGAN